MGELAVAEGDDLVAWGQSVGERNFPAAGARAREDEGRSLCRLEDHLGVLQDLLEEGREPGVAVVLRGSVHCPLDLFMDVDWTCRAKAQTSVLMAHAAIAMSAMKTTCVATS